MPRSSASSAEEMVVVSPDVGSVSRARTFAQKLHMGLAIVDKRRQKANQCEVMNVIGDVRGQGLHPLRRHGGYRRLPLQRRQGHRRGWRREERLCLRQPRRPVRPGASSASTTAYIKELALLNTIPVEMGAGCEKIKYLSVAPMFAEAIERIYQEISIAKLFN